MPKEGHYYLLGQIPTTPLPSETPEPWKQTEVVGKALPRVDAYERLSGSAVYPSDVVLPGMLYAAILRCPHAHARLKSVDVSKAETMPGVHAVIHDGTPGAKIPWYNGPSGPLSRLFDPQCRYEGDEVAAVAAETPYQARDALDAIAVAYDVLPFAVDEEQALKPGAPPIWEAGNRAGEPQVYERGDVARGLAEADVVLETVYRTPCQIHTPMELHGCVARWDGSSLTVWESSQGVYTTQGMLAEVFGLPLANVRVVGHYVGGGFGSKLWSGKLTPVAALLSKRTARPVKLFLSREETLLCMGNRPANEMRLKAGVARDGKLTALEMEATGSGGAYNANGTVLLDWQVRDLYRCEHVKTTMHNVFINAGEQRPMRAPGHPQCSWALEQMLDALAEEIGMDPVALRVENLTTVSQARGGVPYTSTGLKACLVRGAEAFGWSRAHGRPRGDGPIVRGVGMAGCIWIAGAGGPPATVIVKYFEDGSVLLNMGASDIGTGTKTVMAMVVAEELGVPLERIRIEHADTGTTQFATPSGGSKTVPTEAPAVRAAALDCKRQLLTMAATQLEVPATDLQLDEGTVRSTSDPDKSVPVREIQAFRSRRVVVGTGYRGPNPPGKATCPFAAQFCEVEVNTRTGEVRVLRFLGAHDSGRVMNRMTYDNQVYGGITMGIGFGMMERRVFDRGQTGKMCNLNWHDYKVPTALDVPEEIVSLPVEPGDTECNSTGAKGLGEPVTIPTAAAIANAVRHATGVRVTEMPINPTRLVEMLRAGEKDRERRG
jgi:xanthine dehydrogenase YagR molybdenum-binding subunit